MLGIMIACLVVVGLLGTMAGGNAVIGPIALITLSVTWFMLQRIQERTRGNAPYELPEELQRFIPTPRGNRATVAFVVTFLAAALYGIAVKAPTSFVVVIMLGLSLVTGFAGGLKLEAILELVVQGMAGNVGLFFLFLLLDPFITFVEKAGASRPWLATLLKPFMEAGGKVSWAPSGSAAPPWRPSSSCTRCSTRS
jgi:hypothetical protein